MYTHAIANLNYKVEFSKIAHYIPTNRRVHKASLVMYVAGTSSQFICVLKYLIRENQ